MELLRMYHNIKANMVPILKTIGKQHGLLIAQKKGIKLSVAQAIVTHDHTKAGTNGLYCMKHALETFLPDLKRVISSGICTKVTALEKEGVIPVTIFSIDCTNTKNWQQKRSMYVLPFSLLG